MNNSNINEIKEEKLIQIDITNQPIHIKSIGLFLKIKKFIDILREQISKRNIRKLKQAHNTLINDISSNVQFIEEEDD